MTGHTPFKDLKHKADPRKVSEHRQAMERELTLAELRKARDLTQTQLAAALDTTQPGISKIEQRTDLYVSTLRSYVEALGGHLEVTAVFADGPVSISTFSSLAEPI
jgi:transcriptional regulator with XRE-family HTH domain